MLNHNFQPKGLRSGLGWYDRGYIPHFEAGETAQFLTFRLFDSLPAAVVEKWREETDADEAGRVKFRKNIENYLDKGFGSCFLKDARIGELIEDGLFFHAGSKYELAAWVVMPNHLHFLATPRAGVELAEIAHSIKSYTAHEANKLLRRRGQFWQHEPFDRYIRSRRHYANVVRYIENNPVKARLCESAAEWRFSSAYYKAQAKSEEPIK